MSQAEAIKVVNRSAAASTAASAASAAAAAPLPRDHGEAIANEEPTRRRLYRKTTVKPPPMKKRDSIRSEKIKCYEMRINK